jgi:aminoglycoside phosphotransferase (APT) family kinase protein
VIGDPAIAPERTTEELAASLCAEAGLGSLARVEAIALSRTNGNFVVAEDRGVRCVLRRYREQPPPHTALARLRRERWVLATLAGAGVPVPRVLASSEEPGAEALLMEFVDGEPLGSLVARLPSPDAAAAWGAAGRALAAVHALDNDSAAAAGCEQAGIRAPHSSRGPYHYEEALTNLSRLGRSRPDLPALRPLRAILDEARPLFEHAPLALCQYDVHLWQFMLARRGTDWACVAILDWEHADLDDPDWDLAQLDIFRFERVGATPSAFFAGYGRTPMSPLFTLYRLERAAWILDAYARGEEWLALSAPLAESFLRARLERPERLRADVDKAIAALS